MRTRTPLLILWLAILTMGPPALSFAGCGATPVITMPRPIMWPSDDSRATGAETVPAFVPKTGQHGVMVHCGGNRRTPANPLGVHPTLFSDPDAFFMQQAQRALRLHEITGNARIVFHMLNGWDVGKPELQGMAWAAPVLDAMPPRRRAAFERAVRILNEAGVTVGTYSGGWVPAVIDSMRMEDVGDPELFDFDNPRHRETMLAIFEPLIDIGVTEIWVDNTSRLAHRESWVKMAGLLRERGAYFVMEAVPRAPGRMPTPIDLESARQVASSALDSYIYSRNDVHGDPWLPLPQDSEFVAIISTHQTIDGTVPPLDQREPLHRYLAEQTTKRLRQGFTVFNMASAFDETFFALVREWTRIQRERTAD